MSDGVHFLQDLQASAPDVQLGLSRAGVSGVRKAIRIRYGDSEKLIAADIDCTVDLDPAQKGVHMSRFPELFEEAIEEVVIEEALLVEHLAEHIAAQILERQNALQAEVRIVAQYPLGRRTPGSGRLPRPSDGRRSPACRRRSSSRWWAWPLRRHGRADAWSASRR